MIQLYAIAGSLDYGCSTTATYENGAEFECLKDWNGDLDVTPINEIAEQMVAEMFQEG